MRIALHPSYSPGLAPSDFFSFGHLKNHLQGQQFGSADELLSGVREILDEISVGTLEAVFREWINKLADALQELESTYNEANNGSSCYS
jgi:hypothetical protein